MFIVKYDGLFTMSIRTAFGLFFFDKTSIPLAKFLPEVAIGKNIPSQQIFQQNLNLLWDSV